MSYEKVRMYFIVKCVDNFTSHDLPALDRRIDAKATCKTVENVSGKFVVNIAMLIFCVTIAAAGLSVSSL